MDAQSSNGARLVDADGKLTADGQKLVAENLQYAEKLASKLKAGKPELAEEIEAVAKLAIVEAVAKYDNTRGMKFSTYAYRVIHWRVADFLELEWLRKETNVGSSAFREIADSGPPACNRAEAIDAREFAKDQVDKLLGCLPKKQAEAIRLVRLEGLTYEEAAVRLGVTKQSVWNWCDRGIQKAGVVLAKSK